METKTLEAIHSSIENVLFQVYDLGVQQTDCDLTKRANTIIRSYKVTSKMLANQRIIEELEKAYNSSDKALEVCDYLEDRIKQLKRERDA